MSIIVTITTPTLPAAIDTQWLAQNCYIEFAHEDQSYWNVDSPLSLLIIVEELMLPTTRNACINSNRFMIESTAYLFGIEVLAAGRGIWRDNYKPSGMGWQYCKYRNYIISIIVNLAILQSHRRCLTIRGTIA